MAVSSVLGCFVEIGNNYLKREALNTALAHSG